MTSHAHAQAVRPDATVDGIVTHGVYQVATGKWGPGERLPSVRRAAELWAVDPRVVLKAYRRLDGLGLVEARPRSGYFVARGPEPGRVGRHRHELARLFERFQGQVLAETGLSPLGVFHYFAHLARIRALDAPPCAFVECTATQARGHADEVAARLGVPCLAWTTAELTPGLGRLPDHVRTLLVSAFHGSEVEELARGTERELTVVPLEVAGSLFDALPMGAERAILFESDETEARNILADVASLEPPLELVHEVVSDADEALEALLGRGRRDAPLALLSPRLYGAVEPRWREHPRVREVAFRVRTDAWPAVADAIGLPLGSLT